MLIGWSSAERSTAGPSSGGPARGWAPRADNPRGTECHPGLLLNISQTGLCVVLDRPAPANRQIWVGFMDSDAVCWVEVVLRSLSASRPDSFQLRLAFAAGCPYEVFCSLVLRPSLEQQASGRGGAYNAS